MTDRTAVRTRLARALPVPITGYRATDPLPGFATGWVTVITLGTLAILLLRAGRYDWYGDELYFLAAGHRPAVSYVDQGPVLPLLAYAMDAVAPGSRTMFRLPAILCAVGSVILTAVCAREFGGDRRAQVFAAVGAAGAPFLIFQSASLSTFALDSLLVALLLWLLVRWVRTGADGLLVGVALTAALAFQVKPLVPLLLAAVAAGVPAFGPRALFGRPALWVAGGVAALTTGPALAWQAAHGWPQLGMGAVIRGEQLAVAGGIIQLPVHVISLTGPLGTALGLAGLWALVRTPELRDYRFLAAAAALLAAFVGLAGGRPYYLAGLFPVLFGVGAVAVVHSRALLRLGAAALGAISLALTLVLLFALPVPAVREPARTQREMSDRLRFTGTTGWAEFTAAVEKGYERVPAGTPTVTENYWQAAGLEALTELPSIYSPNRGYAPFGAPPESARTVLYVLAGAPEPAWRTLFPDATAMATADRPLGFPGLSAGVTIWRCDRPAGGWAAAWNTLSTNHFDAGW
ncbi:glycosyltransferase family 39 protein [Nocardia asteroides]|uniref:glycosyltransferase family 39 protein n=1 Tax=Nocardia asteroides TaxID=1824 RepID=UPI001E2FEFF4|nr:glycosyltransferase family 39 protein [Nocardia asteroides]UGT62672.1 glycosyltransferase family 39 protein [Nocardia asteroides]